MVDIQSEVDALRRRIREQVGLPDFTPTPMRDLPEEERLEDLTVALLAEQFAARQARKRAISEPPSTPQENH